MPSKQRTADDDDDMAVSACPEFVGNLGDERDHLFPREGNVRHRRPPGPATGIARR